MTEIKNEWTYFFIDFEILIKRMSEMNSWILLLAFELEFCGGGGGGVDLASDFFSLLGWRVFL